MSPRGLVAVALVATFVSGCTLHTKAAAPSCLFREISGSASVPAHSQVPLADLNPYGPWAYTFAFPFTVPDGVWFVIKVIHLWAKHLSTTRSSGVVLFSVHTVGEHFPSVPLTKILPPGFRLDGHLDNQADESQNMIVVVTGFWCTSEQDALEAAKW